MLPVKKVMRKAGKGTQFAALCFRQKKGKSHEILLVTSRKTGRWVPPKGWPMKGKSAENAAAQEALEEAGVKGIIHSIALGRYKFHRTERKKPHPSQEAYIFPLEVSKQTNKFKEAGQRKVKWFSPKKAAMLVREPKLKKIIRDFDPKKLAAT